MGGAGHGELGHQQLRHVWQGPAGNESMHSLIRKEAHSHEGAGQ